MVGGAGFIGSNAAARCLRRGDKVVILDNLSKRGAQENLEWLCSLGPLQHVLADVRDADAVEKFFADNQDAALVLHLAGQVAVTRSLANPREDFEANALGTLNVLEAMRRTSHDASLIFSSTNKVYGSMEDLSISEGHDRYSYGDLEFGIAEDRGLDFHSPYGCSKGAADQYVRDYCRIYGLKTVVFRQSCIYGPRQFGVEDQGWVAWFTIAAQLGRPITLYGDGKQVRDVLYIDDLLDAFDAAHDRIDDIAGRIYNIGGGCENTLSLRELLGFLEKRSGKKIAVIRDTWRSGDQKVYVSDIRRAYSELGWKPRTAFEDGLEKLYQWVETYKGDFA
ncbi:MAG: NAD-dependent epimerase/dehydratase family protein [Gemmatimonadaceae bacterium]